MPEVYNKVWPGSIEVWLQVLKNHSVGSNLKGTMRWPPTSTKRVFGKHYSLKTVNTWRMRIWYIEQIPYAIFCTYWIKLVWFYWEERFGLFRFAFCHCCFENKTLRLNLFAKVKDQSFWNVPPAHPLFTPPIHTQILAAMTKANNYNGCDDDDDGDDNINNNVNFFIYAHSTFKKTKPTHSKSVYIKNSKMQLGSFPFFFLYQK